MPRLVLPTGLKQSSCFKLRANWEECITLNYLLPGTLDCGGKPEEPWTALYAVAISSRVVLFWLACAFAQTWIPSLALNAITLAFSPHFYWLVSQNFRNYCVCFPKMNLSWVWFHHSQQSRTEGHAWARRWTRCPLCYLWLLFAEGTGCSSLDLADIWLLLLIMLSPPLLA